MGKIISIANFKGGVGKTTSTVNIGAGLSLEGKRILLIDLDPQFNLTQSLGLIDADKPIYGALRGDYTLEPVAITEGLFLIPSSLDLIKAEIELSGEFKREEILTRLIAPLTHQYDYILIDCPPSLGALTVSALTASDYALIVLQPEPLSIQGMTEFVKILRTVKTRMNPELDILGLLITSFDSRTKLHKELLEYLETEYKDMVFKSKIRTNISIPEAQSMGQDIFQYAPNSPGAEDYHSLTNELILRVTGE